MTAPENITEKTPPAISISKIISAAQETTTTKTALFITITIIITLFYALIFYLPLRLLPPIHQPLTLISITFLVAFTIHPLRSAIEELFREIFPELDYNSFEVVKRLNTISYTTLTLDNLSKKLQQEMEVHLHVDQSALIIKEQDNWLIKGHNLPSTFNITPDQIDRLIQKSQNQTLNYNKLHPGKTKVLMEQYGIKLVIPLHVYSQVVGLLVLMDKYTHQPYAQKDVRTLEMSAPKISFAIQNSRDYEVIRLKNQKLIDELKLANDKLRQLNHQLRHDDQLKDELIYIATHELKNPVTAMKGYLSLLLEGGFGDLKDKTREAIEQINSSNQQLIGLLNNLLQIARSEAQKIEIHTKPTPICDVIDEVITDLRPLAHQKSLNIIHSCPTQTLSVMADTEPLQEIINNLISNAIKYSDKGIIEISHEINQDQLITHVKDQGVGIAEKDQSKIFTRFFRVEEEAAKGIPGTGLGLFIIKEIVERMGGKIWFESKISEGSTFSFSLPIAHSYSFN